MKKLLLAVAVLFTTTAFAQPDKGMVEFSLGGPLFASLSEAEVSQIGPAAGVGFFLTPAIEVGGELAILKFGGDNAFNDKFSAQIGAFGAYHFAAKEKMWPYAKVGVDLGIGDGPLGKAGGDDAPFNIMGGVGIKYWPMEGGAITAEVNFTKTSPSAIKETRIGVDLGILIRLK